MDTTIESNVRRYSRLFPTEFVSAEGATLFDSNRREYLDFFSCAGALNYGHNDPDMQRALLRYIEVNGITLGLDLATRAKREFLERFQSYILQPREYTYRVQFTGPSGTDAVEAGLKLARNYTKRQTVVAFTNAFHGVTLGSSAVTANSKFRRNSAFGSSVIHAPFDGYFGDEINTAALLQRQLSDSAGGYGEPAAIIVETIQGEGGINVATKRWLQEIEAIARENHALFIVDDVQMGCGRTGTFFSFEELGCSPDMIVLAKSLSGNGSPLAVLLIKPEFDVWKPGEYSGTFRGNNHAFVTGTVALDKFWSNADFTRSIREKAAHIEARLMNLAERFGIELRGRGMIFGIDTDSTALATQIQTDCFGAGLLIEVVGSGHEVIKVAPPLTIDLVTLDRGLDLLEHQVIKNLEPKG
jgi:diaminobutyrate-2-oxoglutarate transaminase